MDSGEKVEIVSRITADDKALLPTTSTVDTDLGWVREAHLIECGA